ncbi:MAG: alanine dehydrogenase [Chlamydiae bacterium]|nr:alanine dehydrogenase [Chlamydiota bacterium]
MLIGIPKEIKDHEYRVGATPAGVQALVKAGNQVIVQSHAGAVIGFSDDMYRQAGATIVASAAEVYQAEMIIKVKEPQTSEFSLLKEGQILFGYLHLAADPEQAKHLLERKVVGISYDTVIDKMGRLPLLIPSSEIAGRMSIQAGATALQIANGGKGILLGGIPGVPPAEVVVLGGGILGTEALRMALGLGASVTVLDVNVNRLRQLEELYAPGLKTLVSTASAVEESVLKADLVIGAVLIPGKSTPKVVPADLVRRMEPGSVIVDPAIDQGGCIETSRPTTHSNPTYIHDGVVHYCVTNMPGACARTATQGLTNATLPYALQIANKSFKRALQDDPGLMMGLNVCLGKITNKFVAEDLGYEYCPPERLF